MKATESKQVTCEVCGKTFAARGIKSHMRLFHHLKVTEKKVTLVDKYLSPVSDLSHNSTKKTPTELSTTPKINLSTKVETIPINDSSHIPESCICVDCGKSCSDKVLRRNNIKFCRSCFDAFVGRMKEKGLLK